MKALKIMLVALALVPASPAIADWGGGGGGAIIMPVDVDEDGFTYPEDCVEGNPNVFPGAPESCNGFDDDCDGQIDEGAQTTWWSDFDGDGYGDGAPSMGCWVPAYAALEDGDCDDSRSDVSPGAAERCDFVDDDCDGAIDEDFVPAGLGDPRIEATFFGQTHLMQTDEAHFGLVAGREAMVKTHVLATTGRDDVRRVVAILKLGTERKVVHLQGPDTVPDVACIEPGQGGHRADDAFVGIIPADWVAPGLRVRIKVDRLTERAEGPYDSAWYFPEVGAPTALVMNMFDVRYFSAPEEAFDPAWRDELKQKLPVASLDVQRIPVDFPMLVVPPRPDVDVIPPCVCPEDDEDCVPAPAGEPCDALNIREGLPGYRVDSQAAYLEQSGFPFDGEQAAALQWSDALSAAGGQRQLSMTWINIHGVWAGGQAGDFRGVGAVDEGILIHEVGHALGLKHLVDHHDYPYLGDDCGIDGPGEDDDPRVGPQWGLDLRHDAHGGQPYFIPPTVQPSSPAAGAWLGHWKRSPMQRVGNVGNDYEAGFLYQMFSNWGVDRMRSWVEGHVAVWNPALSAYATWNAADADYTAALPHDEVARPVEDHVSVISVMVAASGITPELDMVYPPIGPYQGGLIRRFDPSVATDRAAAGSYCDTGCDLTVRITQGGQTRLYMLDGDWRTDLPDTDRASLSTRAVNLPATDGDVTAVELYHTPAVEQVGLPAGFPNGQTPLATWSAN